MRSPACLFVLTIASLVSAQMSVEVDCKSNDTSCVSVGSPPASSGINFNAKLTSLDGQTIQSGTGKDAKPMTLGDAAVFALEATGDEDRNTPGAEKFKRDELARKVYGKASVVLSVEEIALIKDRIGKVFSPSIVGASWRLLEPGLYK